MNERQDPTQFQNITRSERADPHGETDASTTNPDGAGNGKAEQPGKTPARPIRRILLASAAVLALGVGIDYGRWYWTTGRFEESTDDAYVKADSTIVAPKVSGYLRQVAIADNEPVKAGQLLARIDDSDYALALKQAAASVEAAKATVANIQANIEQQDAVVAQARASLVLDEANLTFAQQENDRYTTLAKSGSGSLQNAQNAVSKLGIAQATLERDKAAVRATEKQIGSLTAQLAKARADLSREQHVEEQSRLNVGYTVIAAAVDGVVGNRTLRVGQYVQAGTPLMSIVPLKDVYIVANFKETQLTYVTPGQPVRIEVDSYPDHAVPGIVDSLAPASGQEFALLPPDNATGNFTKIVQRMPVKIKVSANSSLAGRLLPGMSVVPTIDTKAERLR